MTSADPGLDEGFAEFLQALEAEKDAMPSEAYEQIMAAMHRRWAAPPLEALEAVLGKPVPLAKARQVLFYPSDEEMALYPRLVAAAPEGAPDSHPQAKMQVLGLTLLYLVHGRAWVRMKPFIEAGGLLCMVDLLASPNLYLASQAMQVLLHATDEEMYPWHDPNGDGTPVRQGPEALLWRRMFELSRSQLFAHLIRHQNPDTFPGSGLLALRLMAFFMSWLRYHFTPNRVLRLSADLLGLLKEWSTRSGLNEEEQTLATQLYEDFSRYPPAVADAAPQLGSQPGATTLQQQQEGDEEVQVVTDRTQVNHVEPSEADLLRQAGNDAYRKGDFSTAVRHYTAALDVPVPAAELLEEGPRRAALLSNRAAAYLARAAEAGPGGKPGGADDTGLLEGLELGTREAQVMHYEAALIDAQAALDLEPTHIKALFRKSQALYWLGRYQPALDCCQEALKHQSSGSDGKGGSMQAEVAALCDEIKRCMVSPGSSQQSMQEALSQAASAAGRGARKQEEPAAGLPAMLNVVDKPPEQRKPPSKVEAPAQKKGPLVQEVVAFGDGALGKGFEVEGAGEGADYLVPAVHVTSAHDVSKAQKQNVELDLEEMD